MLEAKELDKLEEVISDWNIMVPNEECGFIGKNGNKGPDDCCYNDTVVPCFYAICPLKSTLL